ncbi:hypothetical protein SynBIOSE41_03768 [Synechococcus sp. BIOS-E4-1]|nr:hypothetical protein SynBIOSE41_03768 [Synechococcus sp. BIOS-E4-1]
MEIQERRSTINFSAMKQSLSEKNDEIYQQTNISSLLLYDCWVLIQA